MERKLTYGFSVLAFLVLVLAGLFLLFSTPKEHKQNLDTIVDSLAADHYDGERIDQAMRLLYASENDFRLFVVTLDPSRLRRFSEGMANVATTLDSVDAAEKDNQIADLLEDKKTKTSAFINAKLLADSLARLSARTFAQLDHSLPERMTAPALSRRVEVDTIGKLDEQPGEDEGKKKGFIKRLIDAIRKNTAASNREEAPQVIRERVVIERMPGMSDSSRAKELLWTSALAEQMMNLKESELTLLKANESLFVKLKDMLNRLKASEVSYAQQRHQQLRQDAQNLIGQMSIQDYWEQGLVLLLAGIILVGIWLLYKHDRQLITAKQEAVTYARLKSDFISTMSHEIRTPLQSITGYAHALAKKPADEETKETVDAIQLSSHMLLSVVNNILDYTKMETAGKRLMEPFSPVRAYDEVTRGLLILAREKRLELQTEQLVPGHTQLIGDVFQLKQVLINLLSNAIKYTREGEILVRMNYQNRQNNKETTDGVLSILVKDTGIGIAEEDLERIFDEFHQVGGSIERSEKSNGTGLGLSIVKKIVNLHKGEIKVDSRLGEGTTFYVDLPYKLYDPLQNKADSIATGDLSSLKMLLVDNDLMNRKYLSATLQREGVDCLVAASGEEAWELFLHHPVDLVLTDVNMAGMNGFELVKRIRDHEDKQKSTIPVIAVTGEVLHGEAVRNLGVCFSTYLMKPYTREQLINRIKAVLLKTSS